jgi:hypothetical protein
MQLKRIGRGVVVGAMVVVVGAVGCRFGRRCRRYVLYYNMLHVIINDKNSIHSKEF